MVRRLVALNGLAMFAVVINHAAGIGFTAMFFWTDRYSPVTVPNFDQMGSFWYYVLVVIKQLTPVAIPAFLFVSGFFVAYAARGNQSALTWRGIGSRILNLLIPYFIWSVLSIAYDFRNEGIQPITEYVRRLLTGSASPHLFFVPAICQLYFLSPFLVPLAKHRPKLLLLLAALVQLANLAMVYFHLGLRWSNQPAWVPMMPDWTFVPWIFYFAFGVVAGLHSDRIRQWLARLKWQLLVATIALALLAIIEGEFVYRVIGEDWRGGSELLSLAVYEFGAVLCFLAFENLQIPFSGFVDLMGRRSYGIYLAHFLVLTFSASVIYHVAPAILQYQFVLVPLLVIVGIGIPMLSMTAVTQLPVRFVFRYIFG